MSTSTRDAEVGHTLGGSSAVLVDRVHVADRAVAAAAAERVRALAALQAHVLSEANLRLGHEPEMQLRSAADEVALGSKVHGRTIVQQMDEAWSLVEHYPATVDALEHGEITLAHARVIRREGFNLLDDERRAYELVALDRATHESPMRLQAILRAVSEEFKSTSVQERHDAARKQRRVYVLDHEDGMSDLCAHIPTYIAHGILDGLTTLAGSVQKANVRARKSWSAKQAERELAGFTPDELAGMAPEDRTNPVVATETGARSGDDAETREDASNPEYLAATDRRSIDQIRADALCDLMLGSAPALHGDAEEALHAVVHITIPVLSLLDRSDTPADLTGSGPIDIETAKRIAGAASTWERLLTSPIQGQILAVDTYRPSQQQRKLLQARDERCRFQGCRAKPWQGDLDHSKDFAFGGETSIDNLAHLCRYHHTMKHAMGWQIKQLPHGLIEWTDPGGRTYIDVPPRVARFIPTDELPTGAPTPRGQRDLDAWRAGLGRSGVEDCEVDDDAFDRERRQWLQECSLTVPTPF